MTEGRQGTYDQVNRLWWESNMNHLARSDSESATLGVGYQARERAMLDAVATWLRTHPCRDGHELRVSV